MSAIRRRFADVKHGQVHYREAGPPAAPALVMLHTNPTSSRSLEPLMRRLGARRRIVAPDTPGLGNSTPLPMAAPAIADYAAAIGETLDVLGIARFDLYGTHTGANLAAELAITRRHQAGRMILDGIALYTPAMRDDLLANYARDIRPDLDGTHLMKAWHFIRDQYLFWPWFRRAAERSRGLGLPDAETLHRDVVDVLKGLGSYHLAYRASFVYDKPKRLPQVAIPTLVASSRADLFFPELERVAALIPGAAVRVLPRYDDPAYFEDAVGAFEAFLTGGA